MWARGVCAVPECLSTSMFGTPYRDSRSAVASPSGAAPTMRTGPSASIIRRSACRVSAGHQRGEVFGLQEGRWWWRAPVVQGLGALEDAWCPELVVDDAIHVRVILREVSGRILEI